MTTKMPSIGQCLAHSTPSSALHMPRMDATDRSISPLMMISVIGRVMIAISPLDRPTLNRLLLVRNCGETDDADDADDHDHQRETGLPAQRPDAAARSGYAWRAPLSPQRGGEPDRDEPVER